MGNNLTEDLEERIIWSNIIGLTLSWLIWEPFQSAIWTYWQIFLYALGATPFIITLISAVSQLTLSISRIPGGYLADRVGRRVLIVSMTYVIASTYLLMYFATNWEWILIASIISNLALFYQPALSAIIADSLPKKTRGRGFAVINILPNIVVIASPYIAYYYISRYGIVWGTRELLLLSFITGVLAATVRLLTLRETFSKASSLPEDVIRDFKHEYSRAINYIVREMKFLLIGYSLVGIAQGLTYLLQFYALKYLLIMENEWAFLQTLSFILYLVLAFPFSIVTDKIGRKIPLAIASIAASISLLIASIAPVGHAFLYMLVSTILSSLASAVVASALPAMEADFLPQEIRGKGYAVINLINSTVIAVSQLFSGYIYVAIGPRSPFYLATVFWLLSLFAIIKIPETLRLDKERY